MLAVVEHDQQITIPDHLRQPVGVRQVQSGRDCRGHAFGIADVRELHQTRAVRQAIRLVACHFERQPRLAHPARADERDEAMVAEQSRELANIVVAPDQRSQ